MEERATGEERREHWEKSGGSLRGRLKGLVRITTQVPETARTTNEPRRENTLEHCHRYVTHCHTGNELDAGALNKHKDVMHNIQQLYGVVVVTA